MFFSCIRLISIHSIFASVNRSRVMRSRLIFYCLYLISIMLVIGRLDTITKCNKSSNNMLKTVSFMSFYVHVAHTQVRCEFSAERTGKNSLHLSVRIYFIFVFLFFFSTTIWLHIWIDANKSSVWWSCVQISADKMVFIFFIILLVRHNKRKKNSKKNRSNK